MTTTLTSTRSHRGTAPPEELGFILAYHPDPAFVGAWVPLGAGPRLLGRGGSGLVPGALEDPRVSREHAIVEPAGNGYRVRDLSSRNGTFVQGQRIETPTLLRAGSLVGLGDLLLVLRPLPQGLSPGRDPALRGSGRRWRCCCSNSDKPPLGQARPCSWVNRV
jgi:hypothetical protein